MLRKAIVVIGFIAVAVGGGMVGSALGSTQVPPGDGPWYGGTSSRSYSGPFRHYHRNRNWNNNVSDELNRVRLPFNSTNNVNPVVTVTNNPAADA